VVTVATKEIDLGDGKPTRFFSFIPDAIDRKVSVTIKLGDGRRSMSKAEDEKYDLIFMDAFTSDAVPVHLLTKEAFQMYFTKLQPDGIVVINIANRYLRFEPVLGNLAEDLGIKAMYQHGFEVRDLDKYGTNWVVMARNKEAFASLPDKKNDFDYNGESWTESWKDLPAVRFSESKVWTDDYSNLPSILR
jgi:spermidine synthase